MKVNSSGSDIFVSQQQYALDLLHRLGLSNTKPTPPPMATSIVKLWVPRNMLLSPAWTLLMPSTRCERVNHILCESISSDKDEQNTMMSIKYGDLMKNGEESLEQAKQKE
ncbi:hypothetical protein OSB04_002782 [Centaurea solstitialis]|uniref:Uncharacterized protein n=1 Tax=Centaurea solstitialis TaxID=347529 RepID=A0AA38U435_9ASTR|nr:hypothetical protein OSB04_002782 [Centaurea solstitialis]